MNIQRHSSMKSGLLAIGAVLAMFAFVPYAGATVVRVNFGGALGHGYADLTVGTAPSKDTVDASKVPQAISGASGMFSANGLFSGVKITGVQALNHATPPPGEVLPSSYSLFSIPGYTAFDGVSYDNLFYLGGSPLICYVNGNLVFPFSGGLFDLMGVMFTLDNGDFLDLWSYGDTAPGFFGQNWPGGLTYGMKLIESDGKGGHIVANAAPFATASIPEPDFLWLLGAAVVGLLGWRRSLELRKHA